MSRSPLKRFLVLSTVPFLVFAACSTTPPAENTAAKSVFSGSIPGMAYPGDPISGASLKILDEKNNTIALSPQSSAKTYDAGGFTLVADKWPSDFTVVASGGSINNQEVPATWKADVKGYKQGNVVHVNEGTTLVSAYMKAHPNANPADAEARVKAFLGLRPKGDVGVMMSSRKMFGHKKFLAEAQQNGGVDAFIDKLVKEMDGSPEAAHAFVDPPANDVADLAKDLGKGVLGNVGSQAFTWILGETGITLTKSPELKAINDLSSQISTLQNEVTSLQSDSNYIQYQTAANAVTTVSTIETAARNLYLYASTCDTASRGTYWRSVREAAKELRTNEALIYDAMVPPAGRGTTPLLKLWNKYVLGQAAPFYRAKDRNRAADTYDYWTGLMLAQTLLIANLDNYERNYPDGKEPDFSCTATPTPQPTTYPTKTPASEVVKNHDTKLAAVNAITPQPLTMTGNVIDTRSQLQWSVKPDTGTYLQFSTAIDALNKKDPKVSYRLPTEKELISLVAGWGSAGSANVLQYVHDKIYDAAQFQSFGKDWYILTGDVYRSQGLFDGTNVGRRAMQSSNAGRWIWAESGTEAAHVKSNGDSVTEIIHVDKLSTTAFAIVTDGVSYDTYMPKQ